MARIDPEHLVVGFISKPHGLKGEVFVQPLTDHPEGAFAPGVLLLPADAGGRHPDRALPPLQVETSRAVHRGFLVRFAGTGDRSDADRLRGRYLLRSVDDLEPLAEGEVFYHQLIGLEVRTVEQATVGTIREVYEMKPADLLEVATTRGALFVPFLASIVVDVGVDEGILVIDPPDGLLDL